MLGSVPLRSTTSGVGHGFPRYTRQVAGIPMDPLLRLEFDYPDLPIGFVSRVSRLDPEELRAGVGLGLCNPEFASQLRAHGLVSEQTRLRPFDAATFNPRRSNPAWIWFLLHVRWLFENDLVSPGAFDSISALNADFMHPEGFEFHPSTDTLETPPTWHPRIVEEWARSLSNEFETRLSPGVP